MILSIVLAAALQTPATEPLPNASGEVYDCGTLSLYLLARLEGCGASLQEVERLLPESAVGLYSLLDLREAGRALGVDLRGIRLEPGTALSTPALVHRRNEEGGHFVVIRPVGHTGRLVQVMDGPREPYVIDAADFFADTDGAGLALVASRGSIVPSWVLATGGGACLLLAMGRLWWGRVSYPTAA